MEDIPDFMENMMNPDAGAASGGNGSGRNPHRRRHRHARHVIPIGRSGSGNQLADQFIQVLSEWLHNMGQSRSKILTGQFPVWSQNQYYIFR